MTSPIVTAYGAWPSPVTAASLVEGARGIGSLQSDRGHLYWVESRPDEGGRLTIMRWRPDGELEELLAAPFNVRSRVHEYGGVSYLVHDGVLWFSNFTDQRLYRFQPGKSPRPMTPEVALRFAACAADPSRRRLLCVREDHRHDGEPRNELVAVAMDGDASGGTVVFGDGDFVSAPSLSADGRRVAFVSWRHPNMPWDDTTLWSAAIGEDGLLDGLVNHNPGLGESVMDPQWSDDGRLYALSDRDNWWSIYRVDGERFERVPHDEGEVEIGGPMWSLGAHFYRFLGANSILATVNKGGAQHLAMIDLDTGTSSRWPLDSVGIGGVVTTGDGIAVVSHYADRPARLLRLDRTGVAIQTIRVTRDAAIGAEWVPRYRQVSFPTAAGEATAHGIYLPPTNPDAAPPPGEAPPLIVTVHGGPTGVASPALSMSRLYWTSRGFAILDLNYRGSTGFGREYRRALYGQWGVADVEDAVAGAGWLAEQGLADRDRLIITGGSAGGFTALAAHAFHEAFSAGASHYGISDLEALARETHKFESRYTDQIIGPYPERRDLYRERSPIHRLDGFTSPLILFQGLDDEVVPPNQSEMIYEALKKRGIPTAYVSFEGEGHGFRKAENIVRALEAELYFYAQVLGFETADELPTVDIDNLD